MNLSAHHVLWILERDLSWSEIQIREAKRKQPKKKLQFVAMFAG